MGVIAAAFWVQLNMSNDDYGGASCLCILGFFSPVLIPCVIFLAVVIFASFGDLALIGLLLFNLVIGLGVLGIFTIIFFLPFQGGLEFGMKWWARKEWRSWVGLETYDPFKNQREEDEKPNV